MIDLNYNLLTCFSRILACYVLIHVWIGMMLNRCTIAGKINVTPIGIYLCIITYVKFVTAAKNNALLQLTAVFLTNWHRWNMHWNRHWNMSYVKSHWNMSYYIQISSRYKTYSIYIDRYIYIYILIYIFQGEAPYV